MDPIFAKRPTIQWNIFFNHKFASKYVWLESQHYIIVKSKEFNPPELSLRERGGGENYFSHIAVIIKANKTQPILPAPTSQAFKFQIGTNQIICFLLKTNSKLWDKKRRPEFTMVKKWIFWISKNNLSYKMHLNS